MKYVGKILFTLLMVACSYTTQAQEKNAEVLWLHGWNGGSFSWNKYAEIIEGQRRIYSIRPSYKTNKGVRESASDLAESADLINNRNIEIIIAHSMGGLVARELERDAVGAELAEAIITLATPNKGALIAENLLNGNVDRSLKVGSSILMKGPISDIKGLAFASGFEFLFSDLKKSIEDVSGHNLDRWYLPSILAVVTGPIPGILSNINLSIIKLGINLIIGSAIESAISSVKDGEEETLTDFAPDSQFLEQLNSHTSQVPIATVICEESKGAVWRFAGSYMFQPNRAPFEQGDDTKLLNARNSVRDVYRTAKVYNKVLRWFKWWRFGSYTRKARKWYAGEKYLSKQFEAEYYQLIGASRNQSTETFTTRLVCSDDVSSDNSSSEFDFTNQPSFTGTNGCEVVKIVLHGKGRVFEKSDGLIPLSHQEVDGIPYGNRYLAKGVNHQEVLNHSSITKVFDEIFNRSDAFRLEKRSQ